MNLRAEYPLNDWISKMGNYSMDYIETGLQLEGHFDRYNMENETVSDQKQITAHRRNYCEKNGTNYLVRMIMTPNDGFLNENQPLPPGVELKLSFDRLPAKFSVTKISDSIKLDGKILELKNVYAQVEYISSTTIRNYHDSIDNEPLEFNYDEVSVLCKSLPKGEQFIRLENLKGGNTPDYVFMAIVPTAGLNGSYNHNLINAQRYGVKEIDLTLNGNHCHGFPMQVGKGFPVWPYYKKLDVLGQLNNANMFGTWSVNTFKTALFYSHKFEGEDTTQGWLGVSLSLDAPGGFTESYSLGNI